MEVFGLRSCFLIGRFLAWQSHLTGKGLALPPRIGGPEVVTDECRTYCHDQHGQTTLLHSQHGRCSFLGPRLWPELQNRERSLGRCFSIPSDYSWMTCGWRIGADFLPLQLS